MHDDKQHRYSVHVTWTGNLGQGTSSYRAYSRNHEIAAAGKPVLPGSSDPTFRGDPDRFNPQEFLVSSLSTCHMLWYLHLCSINGIIVL
jgi:organic hydroperoxide reductase OsmC/OhrA